MKKILTLNLNETKSFFEKISPKTSKKYDNFIPLDFINDNIKYKTQILNVLHLRLIFFYKQSY